MSNIHKSLLFQGSYLRFDECRVVLEGRSPVLVCFRVPDSQQATAAVYDPPLHESDNVLNHS